MGRGDTPLPLKGRGDMPPPPTGMKRVRLPGGVFLGWAGPSGPGATGWERIKDGPAETMQETDGVECRTGGVQFRTGGVQFRTGGVQCRTGGVQCRTAGVQCRTGGVQCRTGGVQCRTGGVQCRTGGVQGPYEVMLIGSRFAERRYAIGAMLIVKQYHLVNGLISSCVGVVQPATKSSVVECKGHLVP